LSPISILLPGGGFYQPRDFSYDSACRARKGWPV